eukprot:13792464-Alexandrium_andersonii.AAC.1
MTSSWSAVGRIRGACEGGCASRECARGDRASPAPRPGPGHPPAAAPPTRSSPPGPALRPRP